MREMNGKYNLNIRRIHTDKGKAYQAIEKRYDSITLTTTTGYNPQHNAIAERINRTIKDPARTMLLAASLPNAFSPDVVE